MNVSRSALSLLCAVCFCIVLALPSAAQSKPCEPKVQMSSLLSGVNVNGPLYIDKLYAKCLPTPAKKSSSNYEYHPYDGGKFSSVLKSANGQTLNTFVWYGENILSLWELSRYEVVGGADSLKKLLPGSYVLEFAVEDKVFQRFPFSVTTRQSSDQFKPETLYFLDGPWRDYAQLYSPNVDRFFQLHVWLRNEDTVLDPKPRAVPFHISLVRDSDKKLLAEDSEGKLNLTNNWQQYTLSFRRPNTAQTKDYSEVKLNELLAADGKYRINLTLDGKPSGSYLLNVKGGRINDVDPVQMRKEEYKIILPLANERQ
jgi:hypothetical protein